MTDATDQNDPHRVAELQSRIRELEEERAELKSRLPDDAQASKEKTRNRIAIVLAVLAGLVLALSVPAIWLNRMVTDTEWYVRTVAPLAEDPDIQATVAAAASEAIIEQVDASVRLEEVLPEDLQVVAAPLGSAIDDFIRKQSLDLVSSDRFARVWEELNRRSHTLVVAAVTGREGGALGVEAGTITLDTRVLAELLKTRLVDAGLGFAERVPVGSLGKQLVVYESPSLARMTTAFDAITRAAFLIPLLGLALAGGAVLAGADRRRAVLWLGGALVIAGILPLQLLYLGQYYASAQLVALRGISTPAAEAAFGIVFRDLIAADRALAVLGAVLWLGALMMGPARWAVATRSGLGGGLAGIASQPELERLGVWVRARKRGLQTAGIVVAVCVLLLLPAPRTVESVLWLSLGYGMWYLLVALFGAEPSVTSESTET
jgi:hypothetical protein